MLSDIIEQKMREKGYRSIARVSRETGIQRDSLKRMLHEPGYNPGLITAYRLHRYLGVAPSVLVECGKHIEQAKDQTHAVA